MQETQTGKIFFKEKFVLPIQEGFPPYLLVLCRFFLYKAPLEGIKAHLLWAKLKILHADDNCKNTTLIKLSKFFFFDKWTSLNMIFEFPARKSSLSQGQNIE